MNQQTTNNPDALMRIIQQVKENYQKPAKVSRRRGKQPDYSALSFLLLAVVAVITRTYKDSELHKFLSKDEKLRKMLEFARLPHRTTIGRRLCKQISAAEEQINLIGEQIMQEVKPAPDQEKASVIDGRMYQATGPRWHKKQREQGIVPPELRNVDVESNWSKSGYRGWVQGYRLVVQSLVWPLPVPVFATWRPNHENEAAIAAQALAEGKLKVTDFLLGDATFNEKGFPFQYSQSGGWVLTSEQLPKERRSWKNDLFDYRKETIELLFQRIIQTVDLKACKVKGFARNGAFVLASVWLYQILFLINYRADNSPAIIKDLIDEARWRIAS
jgi:hypothetical protein